MGKGDREKKIRLGVMGKERERRREGGRKEGRKEGGGGMET
jgi:hypothetical protein